MRKTPKTGKRRRSKRRPRIVPASAWFDLLVAIKAGEFLADEAAIRRALRVGA